MPTVRLLSSNLIGIRMLSIDYLFIWFQFSLHLNMTNYFYLKPCHFGYCNLDSSETVSQGIMEHYFFIPCRKFQDPNLAYTDTEKGVVIAGQDGIAAL